VHPTDLAQRCADVIYAADTASQHLGITVHDIAPGHAMVHMDVADHMFNGHGMCHGGYIFSLADTAFAFACNTYNDVTVAAGADISFLAPVTAPVSLTATAHETHRRGRSGLYDVTVRTGEGAVVAEFRGRSRSLGRRLIEDEEG
jgi:acyl-CoA thioesterase